MMIDLSSFQLKDFCKRTLVSCLRPSQDGLPFGPGEWVEIKLEHIKDCMSDHRGVLKPTTETQIALRSKTAQARQATISGDNNGWLILTMNDSAKYLAKPEYLMPAVPLRRRKVIGTIAGAKV